MDYKIWQLPKMVKKDGNDIDLQIGYLQSCIEAKSDQCGHKVICQFIKFNTPNISLEERKLIRKYLVNAIEKKWNITETQKINLLTPGSPTYTPFASISISHCPFLGVFIISSNPKVSLGIDIEFSKRAKKKTLSHISHSKEVNSAPSYSALWSAKEASYKSLYNMNKKDMNTRGLSLTNDKNFYGMDKKNMDKTNIKKIQIIKWQLEKTKHTLDKQNIKIYNYQFLSTENNIEGTGFIFDFSYITIGVSFCVNPPKVDSIE